MNFSFEAEQLELAGLLREALAEQAPATRLLDAATADDPAWHLLSVELQALGVDLPAAHGGLALSAVELAIVAEEAGRVLAPAGFTASLGLAQSVLLGCAPVADHPDVGRLLARSVEGHRLAVAVDVGAAWSAPRLTADIGASARVTGTLDAVLDAGLAEHVIVVAQGSDDRMIAVVDAAGIRTSQVGDFDATARLSRVVLEDVPATVVLEQEVDAALERASERARLVVAAEALGGARHCLDTAIAHAKQRKQFGRVIGSFQAVKHRLADLLVEVELATSAVYLAACHVVGATEEAYLSSRMALAAATAAFERAARDSVQIHGGMGFTWEHEAHLYVRRAQLLTQLLGGLGDQHASIYKQANIRW